MADIMRQSFNPVDIPRSKRNHKVEVLTSMPLGRIVPIVAIPLLREDSLSASIRVPVEMMETAELLMNPVNFRVTAYVVPMLALARFEGSRDMLDRSYMGQPKVAGGAVVPFIETHAMGAHGSNDVYRSLGLHGAPTDNVNTAYLEAYNEIVNFRRKNRSRNLPLRTRLQATLAEAFWHHGRFEQVVPDFDQSQIDGEVGLTFNSSQLPIKRSGANIGNVPVTGTGNAIQLNGAGQTNNTVRIIGGSTNVTLQNAATMTGNLSFGGDTGLQVALGGITAELNAAGVTLSLANLELAKKTQAMAKIRERYDGIEDEYIIDLLMNGITLPEQMLKHPMLLADKMVRIEQSKRYASDSGNLDEAAVSGGAMVDVMLRVPRLSTGGVVMVTAEAVPEQLFERQRDPFFHSQNINNWPEFMADYLDPEKVDVITKGEIDTSHATPNDTFGYAPKHWRWNAFGPRVGGKFYRPVTNTVTDTVRQRIYAVENVNPALTEDFYIVKSGSMHVKPFLDQTTDPLEVGAVGNGVIEGNTFFGPELVESGANYDAIIAEADQTRIVKP